MTTIKERLITLAQRKQAAFLARRDLVALALTGSLSRDRVWEGSDLDFWGFTLEDDGFVDGVEDGIYWEIDIKPLSWLTAVLESGDWLRPPALDEDIITPLEALWGCTVLRDHQGLLTQLKREIDARVADLAWLRQRADAYLHYGRGCLAGLAYAEPLTAIRLARLVATHYGVSAYWMRRGGLISSAMRIPERLTDHPPIQQLYTAIYHLYGQPELDACIARFADLPADVRAEMQDDLDQEVMPAYRLGIYNGALRYLREDMCEQFEPEVVRGLLGIDADVEAQREQTITQANQLLDLIEGVTIDAK